LHLNNHSEEVDAKILVVVGAILSQQLSRWQPTNSVPSQNFKSLSKDLLKVYESVSDIWTQETAAKVMLKVQNN
jgi:hypothetical protein